MDLEQARHEFFLASYARLLAFLLRQVRDRSTAEDIAQSAYEGVFRDPHFDPRRTDAFGYLRKKSLWLLQDERRKRVCAPEMLPAGLADARGLEPLQAIVQEEERARVRAAVARLPEAQQSVVVRYLAGMDHESIATELGIPVTVVYRRFHASKAALRRLLRFV